MLFFIIGIIIIIIRVIRYLNNSKFTKLNLKDGAFEIKCHDESSILNIYLDKYNNKIENLIKDYKNKDDEHIINLDKTCTLKMYDFILNESKNHELFQSRHHAKTYFIKTMTIKILDYLLIPYNDEYDEFENNIIHTDENIVFKRVSEILDLNYNTEDHIVNKYNKLEFFYILKTKFINKLFYVYNKLDIYNDDTYFSRILREHPSLYITNNKEVRELLLNEINRIVTNN